MATGTRESLSRAQARRVALGAQGFLDPPHRPPTMRTLGRTVSRTGVLQVDSVNVLQRAQFMPLYSRMGPYDVDLLRRAATTRPRRLVEYWAHVQALMPVELWPVMRFRMDDYRAQRGKWRVVAEAPELEASLLAEVRERGPSTARDLDDGLPRKKEHWGWNWSNTRRMLDFLYTVGDLAIAGRNGSFEVRYDLPERVVPAHILASERPTRQAAQVELIRRAARSHGVATVQDLRDYYRMSVADTQRAVATLVETGEVLPVEVEGWQRPAYLDRDARVPRRVDARALLSPFDPVVWERERTQRLFDFHYRIEIYVPAPKRQFGYYVLPFLLGDELVARVDLKADRRSGVLVVKSAHSEQHAPPETAEQLAAELERLAGWLGLADLRVEAWGDLSGALAAAARTPLAAREG
jgi:uncharacterized protein YcaQ